MRAPRKVKDAAPVYPPEALRAKVQGVVILEATLQVLSDVGYDRLTIDAVAAKAKASKATVYRRWPSKIPLVSLKVQNFD